MKFRNVARIVRIYVWLAKRASRHHFSLSAARLGSIAKLQMNDRYRENELVGVKDDSWPINDLQTFT